MWLCWQVVTLLSPPTPPFSPSPLPPSREGYQPFKNATALEFWIRSNSNSTDPFFSSTPSGEVLLAVAADRAHPLTLD